MKKKLIALGLVSILALGGVFANPITLDAKKKTEKTSKNSHYEEGYWEAIVTIGKNGKTKVKYVYHPGVWVIDIK